MSSPTEIGYYAETVSVTVGEQYHRWNALYDRDVVFNRPKSVIHAYDHCRRVLVHALALGEAVFGADDKDALEILAHAAVFHDTRRQDEYLDTGHGARAAAYYREYCQGHKDMPWHEETEYLMRYHDLDDERGIRAIDKRFGSKAERVKTLYAIFKDADALDRFRLGPFGLDPLYLRMPQSRRRVAMARRMVEETMDKKAYADICRRVADVMSKRPRMLLIVDPQNDFINGSLPVPGAEEAMDALAWYIRNTDGQYAVKVVTCDCHPSDHMSFVDNGGQWPPHCVCRTVGVEIWPPVKSALDDTSGPVMVLCKGDNADVEEYSILANESSASTIDAIVKSYGITNVDVCGLAGDVCVAATIADVRRLYPEIHLRRLDKFSPCIGK